MTTTTKAHLALFSVALIYGGNYTVAREVMANGYVQPLGFIVLRGLCAGILFWIFHTLWVKERVQRRDWGRLILCSLTGVAINQTFFFSGLKLTNPINASLIMTTSPIIVMLAAAWFLREPINRRKVIGLVLGLIGASSLIAYGKTMQFNAQQALGDLLVLVNAMSYGIYLVLVKSLMTRYHPITVVKWVFTFGFLWVLPIGWSEVQQVDWAAIPPGIWMAIAYVLLGTTFLAYLLNAYALTHAPASLVGAYIYLQPLLAAIIALSFGREQPHWIQLVSGTLIFLGVYLVSRPGAAELTPQKQ